MVVYSRKSDSIEEIYKEMGIGIPVQIIILFFAVVVHECCHGWMAQKCGDDTAKMAGRITLNPLPHIDIFGTIIFPLILIMSRSPFIFGWAKPVPIVASNFYNPKRDIAKVGAAGPLSNIALGFGFAVLIWFLVIFKMYNSKLGVMAINVFGFAVFINLLLAFFNLIPVPPLDGSRILSGLLPTELAFKYESMGRYSMIVIFFLYFTGILWAIIIPFVKLFYGIFFMGMQKFNPDVHYFLRHLLYSFTGR